MTSNLDLYADSVCDYIEGDFSEKALEEILADACDIAADEFDAETDGEGWTDITDYQACAHKAVQNWKDAQEYARDEYADYKRGLMLDR